MERRTITLPAAWGSSNQIDRRAILALATKPRPAISGQLDRRTTRDRSRQAPLTHLLGELGDLNLLLAATQAVHQDVASGRSLAQTDKDLAFAQSAMGNVADADLQQALDAIASAQSDRDNLAVHQGGAQSAAADFSSAASAPVGAGINVGGGDVLNDTVGGTFQDLFSPITGPNTDQSTLSAPPGGAAGAFYGGAASAAANAAKKAACSAIPGATWSDTTGCTLPGVPAYVQLGIGLGAIALVTKWLKLW